MARALIIFFDLLVLLHCWLFDYKHALNIYKLWTGYRYASFLFSACVFFWIFFILLQKVTKIKPKRRTRRGMKHFLQQQSPKAETVSLKIYTLYKSHAVVVGHFHIAQFSALEQTRCAHMWFHMSEQLFIAHFWIFTKVVHLRCWHGWCHMKLLRSRHVLCTPYNHAPCHFMQNVNTIQHIQSFGRDTTAQTQCYFDTDVCTCNGFSFYLLLRRDQHNMHMQRVLILLTPSERPAQHAYATDSHSTYSFRETSTTSSAGWNPSTLHLKQQPWLLWACHVYAMKSRILKLILVIPVTGLRQAFTSKHSKITAHTSCFHRITVIYHVAITSFVRKSTFWLTWLQ